MALRFLNSGYFAGKVGIGTDSPTSSLTISSSAGGDHTWDESGILIQNLSTTTGESAVVFKNSGTAGTGSNYWFTGLNQSNIYRLAYGPNFENGYTFLQLSSLGALTLDAYDSTNNTGTPTYLLGTDASGNVVKTNTVPGSAAGPYLPLAGGTMTGVTQFNDHTQHGDQVSAKWGAGNDLTIQHNATNSAIANSVGNLYISNHADDKDIIFECDNGSGASVSYLTLDGSTTHAYFSNPGNVGIGTTSPGSKLHIYDSITKTAANPNTVEVFHNGNVTTNGIYPVAGLFTQQVSGGANSFATGIVGVADKKGDYGYIARGVQGIGKLSGNITVNNADMQYMGVEGRIEMEGSNSVNLDDRAYSFYGTAEIDSGSHLKEYHGLYLNTPTNNGTILNKYGISQVDANSKNYFAGNVGIGTLNPSSNLDIENASGVTIDINSSSGDGMFRFQDNGTTKWAIGRDNTQQNFVFSNSAGLASDNVLTLAHSTGNVGIGTTSPTAAKLVVDSDTAPQILVKSTAGGNAKILFEDNSGGTQNASITFDQSSQNTLTIATGYQSPTDLNRINIAPAGNVGLTVRGGTGGSGLGQPLVGIGTSTPTAKLHVAGDVLIDSGEYLSWGTAGATSIEGSTASNKLQFRTSSTDRMIINDTGVGIGTTSPSSKLEVVGSGGTVLDIQGSQGQLFSVTDDLSGDIFAVSDISGVPIMTVNSSGLSTFDGNVNLPDNKKILLGTGNDIELYHDGTHSHIINNTGDLTIDSQGDDLLLKAADDLLLYVQGTEVALQAIGNAGVKIRYNNVVKFETTNAGVSVDGGVTITDTAGTRGINRNNTGYNLDLMGGTNNTDGAYISLSGQTRGGAANSYNGRIELYSGGSGLATRADALGDLIFGTKWNGGAAQILILDSASGDAAFSNNVTASAVTATTFSGDLNGTINTVTTAVTKPNTTDDNTVATTAFVKNLIAELPAGLIYKGTWDADTNTPTLAAGGGEISEGTTTTVTADKLIDSAATFTTDGVAVGDRVRVENVNGVSYALVTSVDSQTQLTLDADIVVSTTEVYIIETPAFLEEGNYYIVSVDGATDLNGITDWKVGDWVVASSTNEWQKIDNSSVLDGQGTGQTIPLWSGSGDSNTLTDSRFTQSSTANIITGPSNLQANDSLRVQNLGGSIGLRVLGDGIVNVPSNYFHASSSQGIYSDGSIKARGGVTDDQGTLGLGGSNSVNNLTLTSNTLATFAGNVLLNDGTLTVGADAAGRDVIFRGGTSGAYFMYDASEDGVVIVAPTDEVALGIRVVGSGQPTVPQFTVGRDAGQYLGIKVDDRISSVIHRQDETDAGIMQMNQEIWDSGTGIHKWNWISADGAGASASTKMTLNKTGELNVSTSVTSTTFLGDLNGTINTATTGVTQTAGNNSTLIATTAYADAAAAAVPIGDYLPLTAGSGSPLTGTLYGTSTNFSGSGDYAGSMILGNGASTAEAHLTIGQGRTDSGYSYIDLVGGTTYSDYGLRVIRNNTGANTTSAIIHRGTGNLEISTVESASVLFKTNNTSAFSLTNTQNAIFEGYVGIGGTNPGANLEIRGTVNTDDCKIYLKENDLYGAYFKYDGDLNRGYIGGITSTTSENAVLSWSRDGSELKLTTSGSTAVTIDSNRDVTFAEDIIIKDVLLSSQKNTDIDTGAEVVAQVAHATYTAAFFDFVVKKGTNVRSGTVYACHDGDTTPLVEFTETSTNDLGDTSDVTLSVDISGTNMRLLATVTSDDWSVKSLIRAI